MKFNKDPLYFNPCELSYWKEYFGRYDESIILDGPIEKYS